MILSASAPTLSVAQLNLWNFFDTADDPDTGDMVVPLNEYKARLQKLALTITTELKSPSIISLNEIENQKVIDDLLALPVMKSQGYKGMVQVLNDYRGIRVGVLYKSGLQIQSVDAPNPKMAFAPDPAKGQINPELLYARAPLVIDFTITGLSQAAEGVQNLTVAINHFKSKLGGDGPEPRRQMQGQYLGEYLDKKLQQDPNRSIIVVGDLNANPVDGAYKKLRYRADGSERFTDIIETIPENDRYTYIYRGQKNHLDHMLVSGELSKMLKNVSIHHINTVRGAYEHKLNPKVVAGISDHDPILATFYLSKP